MTYNLMERCWQACGVHSAAMARVSLTPPHSSSLSRELATQHQQLFDRLLIPLQINNDVTGDRSIDRSVVIGDGWLVGCYISSSVSDVRTLMQYQSVSAHWLYSRWVGLYVGLHIRPVGQGDKWKYVAKGSVMTSALNVEFVACKSGFLTELCNDFGWLQRNSNKCVMRHRSVAHHPLVE